MEPLHPLTDCANCPLYGGEYYGYDSPDHIVDVAIVGGQPSAAEKFKGGYFNTQAGELLRRVFHHHNESPTTYYTPAVLCRAKDKKVPAKAVACCRPRVIAEIEAATDGTSPVLTLGNEAALSVLGASGVTSLRVGLAKRSEWLPQGQRVIPTVNPYSCFVQESQFPHLVSDVAKLFNDVEPFKEPRYVVLDDVVDAYDWLRAIGTMAHMKQPVVTIDIECVLDKDSSFGHPERHTMLCVGLKINNDIVHVITDNALNAENWMMIQKILSMSDVTAQNGKFDLNGIRPYVGKIRLGFDTMLASYCLDERTGIHGLKYMAQENLGTPAYDDEIKKYIGPDRDFSKIPREILYKYNAIDVECTFRLRQIQEKKLKDQGLINLHNFLCRISDVLMDMEYTGITIDKEYLAQLVSEFDLSIMTKEHWLSVMAYEVKPEGYLKGDGINPKSPVQIKKFYADLGIKLDGTDEDILNELLAYKGKFPVKDELVRKFTTMLLEYRKETKLNGTYIQGIKERLYKGRINSSYLLHGTTTGRLSSRNPNLQNIPRQSPIKKMYVPGRPDNVFINFDYKQAELRTLSYFAGDHYFRDIFNDPTRDPFDELVPVLYPGASKPTHGDCKCETCAVWKEQRTMVKTYVYGLNYGRTEFGIAAGFGIPVDVARKHMLSFFSVIPEIVNWQKWVRAQVKAGEDLVTPFGRKRRYTLLTEQNIKNIMNEALAFIPQSTASDICLQAAIWFNDWSYEQFGDPTDLERNAPRIFNLVHDAIMIECHESVTEDVIRVTKDLMIKSGNDTVEDYIQFGVDSSVGKSWGGLS